MLIRTKLKCLPKTARQSSGKGKKKNDADKKGEKIAQRNKNGITAQTGILAQEKKKDDK